MKKKRAITAVVALLLALAVPLNAFAEEVKWAEAKNADELKAAFNENVADYDRVEITVTAQITSSDEIVLNSQENKSYTIKASAVNQIRSGVKITGDGTVVMDKVYITALGDNKDALTVEGSANVTVNGQVASVSGTAVTASDSATVKIDGSGYGTAVSAGKGTGIKASDDANVTVTGGKIMSHTGVDASGNAKVTVDNDIDAGSGDGVDASGNATVEVTGSIESDSGVGIMAQGDSNVTAKSGVASEHAVGIYATENSTVSVTGAVLGAIAGVEADSDATVEVTGNVSGKDGDASKVTGDNKSSNGGQGVIAKQQANVTVNGNVTGGKSYGPQADGGSGISAIGTSTVSVTGNVTGGDQITVNIEGDLAALTGNGGSGVAMDRSATVSVGGDVTGGSSDGNQGEAGNGVYITMPSATEKSGTTGSLTVEGTITGGKALYSTAHAGAGTYFYFGYSKEKDTWTTEDLPTVTLWKVQGGETAQKDGTRTQAVKAGAYMTAPSADEINSSYNYIVKIINTANGTIEKVTAHPGETVTLNIKPDSGYKIATVGVDGAELKSENGVYSFVMPTYGGVTATATFEAAEVTPTVIAPATGDSSNLLLWGALMLASAAVVVFIVLEKKKIRK